MWYIMSKFNFINRRFYITVAVGMHLMRPSFNYGSNSKLKWTARDMQSLMFNTNNMNAHFLGTKLNSVMII
ncbi:hypothetical protein EB796_025051 [Bugula neritina]|uniref:Uncharacterized protein n=1 Tax=Bugula neritina TaxID=10212 RepID=A0A7J7IRS3_BUGNE|nr:hypothetical protein EB796_025051 [Bugula neritina]